MAKASKPAESAGTETGNPTAAQTSDPLGDFAEDLGRFLGGVESKATSWLQQRKDITDQLTQIRDTANQYLQQLGAEGANLAERFQRARRGRPPGSKNSAIPGPGRPPGSAETPAPSAIRTMSASARKRISDAQKARWAKLRAGKTGRSKGRGPAKPA